jgi:hypothetical protein
MVDLSAFGDVVGVVGIDIGQDLRGFSDRIIAVPAGTSRDGFPG